MKMLSNIDFRFRLLFAIFAVGIKKLRKCENNTPPSHLYSRPIHKGLYSWARISIIADKRVVLGSMHGQECLHAPMCGLSRSTLFITEGKFIDEETESYAGRIRTLRILCRRSTIIENISGELVWRICTDSLEKRGPPIGQCCERPSLKFTQLAWPRAGCGVHTAKYTL